MSDSLPDQSEKQRPAHLFKPGQSGNPAGRPKGSRDRLQRDFFKALTEDFAENGKQALVDARMQNPAGYLKVVASLMPKEIEIKRPLEDVTDEQLDAAALAIRAILNAQAGGAGDSGSSEIQQAQSLQALSEAG